MTTFQEKIVEDLANALSIIKFVREGNLEMEALADAEIRIRRAMQKAQAVKLFIDDVRELPPPYVAAGYRVLRSGEVALDLIKWLGLENVTHISFDHDLGEGVMSGYDVVKYIEERVIAYGDPMPEMDVHSDNPAGAKNIRAAIDAMKRHVANRGIARLSN